MRSLIAYFLRSYTFSQRYFAPVAGTLIAVLILYSYKPNPVMNSYAASAVMLFVGCAWLGLSFLNHEQAVQRQVAVVHLRSAVKHSIGEMLTMGVLTLLLSFVIVMYPIVTGNFSDPVGGYRLFLALAGHALLGFLGIAISLYLQSSWVSKNSYAAGSMLIIITLSIGGTQLQELVPGPVMPILLPPVSPVMDALMNADDLPASSLLGSFAHTLAYISVLTGFYLYRTSRMDVNKNL
ncbi:hypothetical protein [Paenibacillus sp. sgz500992]|uniref:hypothetical protein n=1 Tax=Paenibacillus sp. sgz500992 TaxID=3242476 RepID=UPI0036D36144